MPVTQRVPEINGTREYAGCVAEVTVASKPSRVPVAGRTAPLASVPGPPALSPHVSCSILPWVLLYPVSSCSSPFQITALSELHGKHRSHQLAFLIGEASLALPPSGHTSSASAAPTGPVCRPYTPWYEAIVLAPCSVHSAELQPAL